jgi:ParB family transcriptional regulator, chromosome partitioning protein
VKAKGLGRGLDALFDTGNSEQPRASDSLSKLPISQLQRGKYQPRTKMDQTSLEELAASIRAQGLIQPILVRPVDASRYEIIAGERRWRAAGIAGLSEVPVVIRDVPDKAALAMALIENIQREDLNALEEAQGMQRLVEEFHLTHQDLAESVGRSRAAVTNALRLLNLSALVQGYLQDNKLDMGHARALLALDSKRQQEAAKKVVDQNLTVRETEELVKRLLHPTPLAQAKPEKLPDRDVQRLAEEISEKLGTTVEIRSGRKGSGKLIVSYTNNEHLGSLLARLK